MGTNVRVISIARKTESLKETRPKSWHRERNFLSPVLREILACRSPSLSDRWKEDTPLLCERRWEERQRVRRREIYYTTTVLALRPFRSKWTLVRERREPRMERSTCLLWRRAVYRKIVKKMGGGGWKEEKEESEAGWRRNKRRTIKIEISAPLCGR